MRRVAKVRCMREHRHRKPLLVVVTGGIASGKTAVSDHLASKGVPVIDTDRIAREVVSSGTPGLQAVVEAFTPAVLDEDGNLDRASLRRKVFADDSARRKLEAILHPLIEAEARRRIDQHGNADYVLLVVPLLVETGLFGDADRVVVVDVPESTQIERLMTRDDLSREQAERMLAAQTKRQQRLAAATDIIENDGSLAQLRQRADRLHEDLLTLSRRHRHRSTRNP